MVLLRRSSSKASAGDQSKGGTSHERKSKGGNKLVPSAPSSSTATATATGKQTQKGSGSGGGGNWKGRKSGWEARFLFKEPEPAGGDADTPPAPAQEMDTRTTVMIRNIPNKYRYPRQCTLHIAATMLYFMGIARLELQLC